MTDVATVPVKAEAFDKHTWNVPMSDSRTYQVRAGYDPGKVTLDDIAVIAEIEYSISMGAAGRGIKAVGPPEFVS